MYPNFFKDSKFLDKSIRKKSYRQKKLKNFVLNIFDAYYTT